MGFQHLAYEKHEDIASYGLESLLGKSDTEINISTTAFAHHLGPSTLKRFPMNAISMVGQTEYANKNGRKR